MARRALFVLALLVGEFLLLSFAFDVRPSGDVVPGLELLGWLGPWAACCGAAIFVAVPKDEWRALAAEARARPPWPWPVHAAAYAATMAAAALLVRSPGIGLALVLVLSALSTALTAVALLFPPSALLSSLLGRWRAAVFGLLIGTFAFGAGRWSGELWEELSDLTLLLSALLLDVFVDGIAINPDTRMLGLENFRVRIAPVCSGVEGLGLTAVLVGFYVFHFRRELGPRGWWALPLAMLASYAANIIRIVSLILIGEWVSPAVAIGGFHSKAGWILFVGVALASVTLLKRRARPASSESEPPNPVTPYLAPLLTVVAASMLTGLFSTGFPSAYPLSVLAGGAALWVWAARTQLSSLAPVWLVPVLGGIAAHGLWYATLPDADELAVSTKLATLHGWSVAIQFAWIAARFLGGVVIAPVVEELAFRGFLLRRLRGRDFENEPAPPPWSAAAILSSLAFGFAHSTPLAGFLAGLVYAWVYARRGALSDAVVAHAVSNLIIAIQVLALGEWWLWL